MHSGKMNQHSEHMSVPGESLTKLALNNKIVEMRKNVRQSRVQCINKMIKEIRRLKGKKGSEEQISRNLKKADRLVEQVAVMKKVDPDVVSKFALQNEKSLVEITNDMNETVERKALARLACHKSVHQKILEFRVKFPDWKKSLPLLLESLGEKYKNKKRTPVVSKKTERKSNLTRKENSVHKEDLKAPKTHHAASVISSSGLWTVASCESANSDSDDRESENINDDDFIPDQNPVLENTSNSDEDSDSKGKQIKTFVDVQRSKSKPKKPPVPSKNVKIESSTDISSKESIPKKLSGSTRYNISSESDSKSNLKKLQVFNGNGTVPSIEEDMDTESTSAPLKNTEISKIPENISNSVHEAAADSFFITCDNKEYLSISAKTNNDAEKSQADYKEPKKINPNSKFERFPTNPKQFKPKSNHNNSFGKRKNFDSTRGKPGGDTRAAPSLHPSWAAKKKQSTIIQSSQFQGKKIKFDD